MKTKNIQPDIKSKSINDAKSEIMDILEKLEKDGANLEALKNDYQRLLTLNNHIDGLFKERIKKIRFTVKKK